ncbi:non-specific lipid-transfer protein 1-like [Vigna unguiculata]|uniref:Non-specific lipid-transfer protein n=1 Tax=Vigna unguiculata TaxID=3917 RepID=A0A4D6MST8_VIGUN|nr:non-specific lipid-transfer protein 1-like [Vigna unguiculata]QCE03159.1 hypothetical protein DEO72_LG8g1181 [Vigna unguiculata]
MASMKVGCIVAMVFMVVVSAPIAHGITCSQVAISVSPCVAYNQIGGAPSPACCRGLKNLNAAAKNTADRRTACNCLKSFFGSFPSINLDLAASLPSKCSVSSIPYNISTSTNCATIKF